MPSKLTQAVSVFILAGFLFGFHDLAARPAAAQSLHCPDAGEGFRFKGPAQKTDVYGRSTVSCRYYRGRKLHGIITGSYNTNFYKKDLCTTKAYLNAGIQSQTFQAFADYNDTNDRDAYDSYFWKGLANQFLFFFEERALECGHPYGKKLIKRGSNYGPTPTPYD